MKLVELPVVKQVLETGADDRVYDSLVLAGPIVIAIILIGGRSVLTVGLSLLYVGVFAAYLLYNGQQ